MADFGMDLSSLPEVRVSHAGARVRAGGEVARGRGGEISGARGRVHAQAARANLVKLTPDGGCLKTPVEAAPEGSAAPTARCKVRRVALPRALAGRGQRVLGS